MAYTGNDYLEREWYNKLIQIMDDEDANLICRLKAGMERDRKLIETIRRDGFSGFCRWMEIHCRDIYETIKKALASAWEKVKAFFGF